MKLEAEGQISNVSPGFKSFFASSEKNFFGCRTLTTFSEFFADSEKTSSSSVETISASDAAMSSALLSFVFVKSSWMVEL